MLKSNKIILANVIITDTWILKKCDKFVKSNEELDTLKFQCKFYLDKTKHAETITQIQNVIKNLSMEHKITPANNGVFLDMATKYEFEPAKKHLKNYIRISAKNRHKPFVTDSNNNEVRDANLITNGSIVHAAIGVFISKTFGSLYFIVHHVKLVKNAEPIPEEIQDYTEEFSLLNNDAELVNELSNITDDDALPF